MSFKRLSRLLAGRRPYGTARKPAPKSAEKMSRWEIHSYGELDELALASGCRVPHVVRPNEVLVRVSASSVNPIDVAMTGGYGATALNLMRTMDDVEFPLTFGRDFCGEVAAKGLGVADDRLAVGEAVWGVVPVHRQGCHAEYVLVDANAVGKKPPGLSVEEAAGTLYAGLTAWSGLMFSANLKLKSASDLKTLIMGASGGVGNAAVQILRAGGANITATCAADAVPLVESLGAHSVLDYNSPDFETSIADRGRFDLVLDCAGLGTEFASRDFLRFRNYVTFTTPLLKNFDDLGVLRGAVTSAADLVCPNVKSLKNGGVVSWAYFVPSADGIDYLRSLVESKKMVTHVEKVFSFDQLPAAYKRVKDGHLRGKVVINIEEKAK